MRKIYLIIFMLIIIFIIITNLNVDTLDIVEVAPPLDINNITSWLAVMSLYEFFTAYIQKTTQNLDIL